jgi:hypothetical protein
MLETSVIDEDVDGSVLGQGLLDEVAAIGALAEVALNEGGVELIGDDTAVFLIHVPNHHRGAIGRQPLGNRQANATGSSRNQGYFVLKGFVRHCTSFTVIGNPLTDYGPLITDYRIQQFR